jgi:NTE family protein
MHVVNVSCAAYLCLVPGLVLVLTACANFSAVDRPIAQVTPPLTEQITGDRSPDLLVLVAFSGGGTRAAAFAYGVLKTLADTEVMTEGGRRSLLHEVDVISSVSDGSFTSAYYGLRGDKIFEEFEDRFLRQNVEGALHKQHGKEELMVCYYNRYHGVNLIDRIRSGLVDPKCGI